MTEANEGGLAIFVKNLEPGKVKTRLAADTGPEKAMEVYKTLLQITHKACLPLPCQKWVHYSTFINRQDLWNQGGFEKRQQHGPTLGSRMASAFSDMFASGVSRAVLVGSDCPGLTTDLLTTALEALETHDVVLGPALDGGYYLIGMKKLWLEMFHDKPWSTDMVFAETMMDVKMLKLTDFQLPALRDVDTVEDLRHFPDLLR